MLGVSKDAIRDYWEAEPCGSSLSEAEPGSKEFFDEIEATRYRLEPFIPEFAQFERWRGKRVLEIGVGLGTDSVCFARAGATVSGVDLTEASIDLVRRRLVLEGLDADLRVADAEALPFADESFDLVYSWGVLHHTPDTERAIAEVRRVLRRGGEMRIMLYSRRSWVAFGVWARYALLHGRPWRSFADVLAEHMESAGTKAFTQRELAQLFSGFSSVTFTRFVTPHDRRVSGPVTRVTGPRFGWFVGASGRRADRGQE
jgi:ubiquinone/menaquinone biosynthesis C-methylase UbiE